MAACYICTTTPILSHGIWLRVTESYLLVLDKFPVIYLLKPGQDEVLMHWPPSSATPYEV